MVAHAPLTGTVLTGLERVDAAGGPFALVRAWPGAGGSVTLELRDASGALVAARWPAGPDAAETGVAADGRRVAVLRAADPALPGLAALAAVPGARVLVHRAGRRAVVALPDGTFAKAVRPRRVRALAAATAHAAALADGFAVPVPIGVDLAAGVVRCAAIPGIALHARPGDRAAAAAAARALRALHARPVPPALPAHAAADEAAVVDGWVARFEAAATGGPAERCARRARALVPAVTAALAQHAPAPRAAVHRDLHDKQVLVDGEDVGLLDCDTLACGEPALDLANLLAHLDLRALQGAWTAAQARSAATAVRAAYAPDPATAARLPAHLAAARLRLACVYAFRPTPPGLVERLIDAAGPNRGRASASAGAGSASGRPRR